MSTPPVNHVFVDFENVHEIDLAVIGAKSVEFTLLIGPAKTKIDLALVDRLLAHAGAVHLIRLASSGRNAVDFALAYYLGRTVLADPAGSFHLVSKDKGYAPLIEHLQGKQVHVRRHDSFATLVATLLPKPPAPSPPTATTPTPIRRATPPTTAPAPATGRRGEPAPLSESARQLLAILAGSVSRPRTRKTLVRHAITVLGNKLGEAQAGHLIGELGSSGKLSINAQDKVEYHFPARPAP